jgi:O-antigen ligase
MIFGVERDVLIAKLQQMQEWLLVAYAISLPLSLTVSWALLIAGLIAWAIETAVRRFVKSDHSHPVFVSTPLPLKWPILGLAVAVAISGAFNPGSGTPLVAAVKSVWSLKGILIYFWASKVFHFRPLVAKWCFQSVLCVSAVAGIWGMIQQVFKFHPFAKIQWEQGTGFLSAPMAFAGQMELFGMMALALLVTGAYRQFAGKLSDKFVFSAIVAANLLGLIFAGQKSAWLGGCAGILVIAALVSFRLFFKTAVVLIAASLLSYYALPIVHSRVDSMMAVDAGIKARLKIWTTAVETWKHSPVVGVGYLNFPHLEIPEASVLGKDFDHAHSNYLHFGATTGVIGLLAYLWLCGALLTKGIKAYIRARIEKNELAAGFYAGVVGGTVSLMVSGFFEYNFGTASVRLVQWFMLALLSYEAVNGRCQAKAEPSLPDSLPNI